MGLGHISHTPIHLPDNTYINPSILPHTYTPFL